MNTPNLVPVILISGFILWCIYRDMNRRKDRYGRAPWGWPLLAWVVPTLISGLLAGLLYWFAARRQDKTDELVPRPRTSGNAVQFDRARPRDAGDTQSA